MKFAAVTTCSLDGWERYGKRMALSFVNHWQGDISLAIYSEDTIPLVSRPFPQWFVDFKARHANNPAAHGKAARKYTYVQDCVRFAHKVAAVTDAAMTTDADVLIWLDADTVTHADVTAEWLQSLMPSDAYIAWLDRDRLYPECGFYMLNLKYYPAHERIMRAWIDLYTSDEILKWKETHDCVSLQKVILEAENRGDIKVHSLSGEIGRKHPHPLANSPVSKCLDHCKGPRKDIGRTPARERVIKDGNPYWQT